MYNCSIPKARVPQCTRSLGNMLSNTNEHPFEWERKKMHKILVRMWVYEHFIISHW